MQIANCQVFTLLVLVGLLMFFTTFLTIDFHTSNDQSSPHRGHEFFNTPRKPRNGSDLMTRTVDNMLDKIKKLGVNKPTVDNVASSSVPPHKSQNIATVRVDDVVESEADERCKLTFEPKCRINPLVKYWDEVMECYTSPLRDLIGLDAPVKDRKFVVFQADSGGWNNIRMALEVVILFAQVQCI